MSHDVQLTPLAISDLTALHHWIATEADGATADRYLDWIEAAVLALSTFPNRGTPRDDLAPGVRTISFERRIVIAYRVEDAVVRVLRVVSGMRELGGLFDG